MPRSTVVLGLLTLATVAAVMTAAQQGPGGARTSIKPGEECPPGTTETRPGTCQAPELAAAEHRRLPPALDAGHRRSTRCRRRSFRRSTCTAIRRR